MSSTGPITKNTLLSEAIQRYPKTIPVFVRYGLHCVGCDVAPFETVEIAAQTHKIKDLVQLLEDLNQATH